MIIALSYPLKAENPTFTLGVVWVYVLLFSYLVVVC